MEFKIRDIGKQFREWRKSANLTLKDVSDNVGMSVGYISRIENNDSTPSLKAVLSLCKLYGVDAKEVIHNDTLSGSTNEVKDINQLIYDKDITYRGKKIDVTDKISILKFINFLTTTSNYKLKQNCIDIIETMSQIELNLKNNQD